MQPANIGDYIVLEKWCNYGIGINKQNLEIWASLNPEQKTEEKLIELFQAEYDDFKRQINNLQVEIKPSFRMSKIRIGDFQNGVDEQLPEPDKKVDPSKPLPDGIDRKNKLEILPCNEKLIINQELQVELFNSIKTHANMVEYMFDKYLTANHLYTVVDNLGEYYENVDHEIDLMTFLNRSFDYDIIKQWFAEGCLTLMIKSIIHQ